GATLERARPRRPRPVRDRVRAARMAGRAGCLVHRTRPAKDDAGAEVEFRSERHVESRASLDGAGDDPGLRRGIPMATQATPIDQTIAEAERALTGYSGHDVPDDKLLHDCVHCGMCLPT